MMEMATCGSPCVNQWNSSDKIIEHDTERNLKSAFPEPTHSWPNKRFLKKMNQIFIKIMNHYLLHNIYVEDNSITRFLIGLITRSVTYDDGNEK